MMIGIDAILFMYDEEQNISQHRSIQVQIDCIIYLNKIICLKN